MAIVSTDISFYLSVATGPGCSAPLSPVTSSFGGHVATTKPVDATLNNLFDNITGDQNAASQVDYRCLFVVNTNTSNTWLTPVAWISAEISGGANAAIGVDPLGASLSGAAPAQAVTIATATTAPSGVTFSSPTVKASGISLGSLAPGSGVAIWIKRAAQNSVALDLDGVTIRVEGDTTA